MNIVCKKITSLICILIILISLFCANHSHYVFAVQNDITYEKTNEAVYTTCIVNVRTGPDTKYNRVKSLAKNSLIIRIGVGDNGWSQVICDGKLYYMCSEYLTVKTPSTSLIKDCSGVKNYGLSFTATNETLETICALNVRMGPSTKYKKSAILKCGEKVISLGVGDNGWHRILYKGQIAYVNGKYLQELKIDDTMSEKDEFIASINFKEVNETVYANTIVNVRTGPSVKYEKVAKLTKGASLTRIGIGDNGWSKVLYKGQVCYVCTEYVQTTNLMFSSVNETVYATTNVNIRSGPGTNHSKLGVLYKGKSIVRIGVSDGGWSKVIYNGKEAYIDSRYLTTENPNKTSNNNFPLTYSDETCTITITKEWYENAWCYIAHLEFTDYSRFSSALAKDKRGSYETTSSAAKRLDAIFCVNGSYQWGENDKYAVVRNGIVYKDISIDEDIAIYNVATGIFTRASDLGVAGMLASDVVNKGLATDTFKFYNSTLVKDGENLANINNSSRSQRTFICTTGKPGDIYIIVSEGRYADSKSAGLTKYECAELILKLGCSYGIMLDGGGSSTMYFNGKVLNSANGNERAVVDFLYFK